MDSFLKIYFGKFTRISMFIDVFGFVLGAGSVRKSRDHVTARSVVSGKRQTRDVICCHEAPVLSHDNNPHGRVSESVRKISDYATF